MDSPERASPKISARHTPQSRKKLADPLLPPRKADDSFTEVHPGLLTDAAAVMRGAAPGNRLPADMPACPCTWGTVLTRLW